jgi:flagellar M-ring protein FliF
LMSRQGGTGASAQAERHLMIQTQVEEHYRRTIMSLLIPMIGADNFTAEVTAEMDFSENRATRETFPKESAQIQSEQGSWSKEPGEKASYGIPGALANRPPEDPELTDDFAGNDAQIDVAETSRTSEKFARKFALGREISVTKQAAGSLSRLSVAVALRSPVGNKQRSAEELAAVEALVKGAIGFQAQRGDVVAIEARSFLTVEEVTENWWEASWVSMLVRNISALLVALVLVLGIGRPLLKKLRSDRNLTSVLQGSGRLELTSNVDEPTDQPLTKPANPVSLDMISSADGYSERAALIQNFVRQNPDHAALTVQDLLAEGKPEEEAVNG